MGKYHSVNIVLREEDGPRWKSHHAQIPVLLLWGHVTMGSKIFVDLLSSGRLDVCQVRAYPDHNRRAPHQFCRLFLDYTKADVK